MDDDRCGGLKEKETSEEMKIAESCAESRLFTIRSPEATRTCKYQASRSRTIHYHLGLAFGDIQMKDSVRLDSDRVLVEFG